MSGIEEKVTAERAKRHPNDLFPYRGQPRTSMSGPSFFVVTRCGFTLLSYSLLLPQTSPYSLFARYPALRPARSFPTIGSQAISSLSAADPLRWASTIGSRIGLAPFPALLFTQYSMVSASFICYALFWRRERMPFFGPGGNAIFQAIGIGVIDTIHTLLFVYLASRNPTWNAAVASWSAYLFLFGLLLHQGSDFIKFRFKTNKAATYNKGKVLDQGPWGIIRHPNHTGFFLWRTAFSFLGGGLAFTALFMGGFFFNHLKNVAAPAQEEYLQETYGEKFARYKKRVPHLYIPYFY